MIQALAFYMFAFMTIASAILVISSRNPVHSVLFLILAFFNAAGLFVLLGAEFLAMILVVVYVGAVAVLFMFVVMMLDINFVEMRQGFLQYLPIGGLVGLILASELLTLAGSWIISPDASRVGAAPIPDGVTNTHALGQVLYTDYLYLFEAAGMILLVAMIGAIVLTHRRRTGVRKQVIADQLARHPADTIELRKVDSGRGI
ncbi:MAG: NADH-quinone oxidoreductase subunit J [Rhodospirillales bacterium]|jgi:NADH-quinone oxidoreductase subunit J|nr:NADH-quinone oxidoreductase subunit J [Rhodospirillales bacterium]MBT4040056.1 NADH-quinone oxidoreductase subunit J [Rhodospirillales bacterium]MBT4627744.1 NADH-quinone oxidoreductase subunit J [Rhodospirillales bacterium]MBT5352988.1 NADH-quinone oxidoreductase subunit J [Rhodospirillales bacterium]MBT5520349.1 NADH-quinone oxidoreductase subunit J [Rhodospirillales bacterium]